MSSPAVENFKLAHIEPPECGFDNFFDNFIVFCQKISLNAFRNAQKAIF